MVEGGLRAVRNRVEAGSGPSGYRVGILALPSDSAAIGASHLEVA
jgi:hypothetical protein